MQSSSGSEASTSNSIDTEISKFLGPRKGRRMTDIKLVCIDMDGMSRLWHCGCRSVTITMHVFLKGRPQMIDAGTQEAAEVIWRLAMLRRNAAGRAQRGAALLGAGPACSAQGGRQDLSGHRQSAARGNCRYANRWPCRCSLWCLLTIFITVSSSASLT